MSDDSLYYLRLEIFGLILAVVGLIIVNSFFVQENRQLKQQLKECQSKQE
ncbi:MAG: hypothetical protein FD167_1598 [bacterium]|nr:MAG: hypothetical protein FD167_1598 [bacterium]